MATLVGPLSKKKQLSKAKDDNTEVVSAPEASKTGQSCSESESCYQKVEMLQVSVWIAN